jgi:hypothetical protein
MQNDPLDDTVVALALEDACASGDVLRQHAIGVGEPHGATVHLDATNGTVLRILAAPDDMWLGVAQIPGHNRLILGAGEHLTADNRHAEHRALMATIRALPLAILPHTHTTIGIAGIDQALLKVERCHKTFAALALTNKEGDARTSVQQHRRRECQCPNEQHLNKVSEKN